MRTMIVGAALLLLAACSSSTSGKPQRTGTAEPQPGVKVVCTATDGGNVTRDRQVLAARAARLTSGNVTVTPAASTITLLIPGVAVADVHDLCDPGVLEFRPLIAPTVATKGDGAPEALSSLSFSLPANEAEYHALTVAQQAMLADALGRITCPYSSVNEILAACDESASPRHAALLGVPIVTGDQVRAGRAVPPSAGGGSQWSIEVSLDADGQQAWTAYTAAHHDGSSGATPAANCGPDTTPCADWVGFVLDGRLLSMPVTLQAISGATMISGNFTEKTAKALAAGLSAGRLPVALRLSSAIPTN